MSKRKKRKQQPQPTVASRKSSAARTPSRFRSFLIFALGIVLVGALTVVWVSRDSAGGASAAESAASGQSLASQSNSNQPSGAVGGGPSIYLPEPSYDFGTISQGDKVSHTFAVQNIGDEPLKLIRAKGS